jgi:hypothetical protein
MTTPAISIIFFILAAFLGALGQYLYKSGADLAGNGVASYVLNWRLLSGVGWYIAVMTLFVAAFRNRRYPSGRSTSQAWVFSSLACS